MFSFNLFNGLRRWLTVLALSAAATLAQAAPVSYTVTAPDGVSIAVQESGNPDGPAIVFVHGLLGSHLSWDAQTSSPLLQRYRLITFDLRGHGQSGKPERADAYTDGRRWADDLAAVIAGSGARQPVIVGWSLGAAVATNYLAAYGDTRIAGAIYVGGVIELKPDQIVPHPEIYRDMTSADLRTHLDAEKAFLKLCFETQPDTMTFDRLLANAALASFDMQRVVHRMTVDAPTGLGAMHKPLLLIYGERDALVKAGSSAQRAKALDPAANVSVYPGAGHAPFVESPDRFNRDLAAFMDAVASY
ncbi:MULTISPECIES: alpha/beta hydrolase [Pandoraea]|uniref:alpha/beta fold hydrolase n=1 Tax=Pandoraea TaxID=93217 RepID=UPI001F5DF2BA|nr:MULTISPECIES: alpha/beta hydrolase [Pandoraea]MCI3208517.1 alpha/beta hydrolase [Pandoraea sp. LA3]MDN4586546.1 alpha/beta hydrolase [Pandoraea capi]